jgi:hypothetical protein
MIALLIAVDRRQRVRHRWIASCIPTVTPAQSTIGGGKMPVAKLNPSGNALIYSTFSVKRLLTAEMPLLSMPLKRLCGWGPTAVSPR